MSAVAQDRSAILYIDCHGHKVDYVLESDERPGAYFGLACGVPAALPFGSAVHMGSRELAEYVARTLEWGSHVREVREYA